MKKETIDYIGTLYPTSSFCCWDAPDNDEWNKKSNIGSLNWLNDPAPCNLRIVFVALNPSRPITKKYTNWHDSNPNGRDFRLRYICHENRLFWGAFITDLSAQVEINSKKVILTDDDFSRFKEKIKDLCDYCYLRDSESISNQKYPICFIALGEDSFDLLRNSQLKDVFPNSTLLKLTHYSYTVLTLEEYNQEAQELAKTIADISGMSPDVHGSIENRSTTQGEGNAMKNYLEGLEDEHGNKLLVLENRRRPVQFRRSGTNWASPKIRLDTDGQDLDFYNDTRDPAQLSRWEDFLDHIVAQNSRHWQKQSGSKKSKLIRINITPTETIEARCLEFYALFAKYDAYLRQPERH